MFRNIAENIYDYLFKRKLINQNDREVYTYALEVIVLNVGLLITLFVISVFMKQLLFFVCYLCFFVPLRIFSGGYHAKRSEVCFTMSVGIYILALLILKNNVHLYENTVLLSIASLFLLIIYIFSPMENENHPLADNQRKRNKIIVRIMVFLDFTLLIIFCFNQSTLASYEVVFVLLNGVLFLIGKIEGKSQKLNKRNFID